MSTEKITSSQLAPIGDVIEIGNYTAKLTKIEAKEAANAEGTNYLSISLEILDKGDAEGLTAYVAVFPNVTKSLKNGKYYSRGLFDVQQMTAAWGAPLPEFSLDEFIKDGTRKGATIKGVRMLQKLIADSFKQAGNPRLRIRIVNEKAQEKNPATDKWEDAKNEDGSQKYRKRTVVLGRANAAEAPKATPTPAHVMETESPEAEEAPSTMTFI